MDDGDWAQLDHEFPVPSSPYGNCVADCQPDGSEPTTPIAVHHANGRCKMIWKDDRQWGIHNIERQAAMLHRPGNIFELRALGVSERQDGRFPSNWFGYFDNPASAAKAFANCIAQKTYVGAYLTLNPTTADLLARAANRLRMPNRNESAQTHDGEITRRQFFPIDIDPKRPAGISSTDAEHSAAIDKAREIRDSLIAQGWPEPILADSGNGAHLLFAIDLPNDDDATAVVKNGLRALAALHDTDQLKIDPSNFNASRIWKLYGSKARKGDSTPDRPHRFAKILEVPGSDVGGPTPLLPVQRQLLDALAIQAPAEPQGRFQSRPQGEAKFSANGHATNGTFKDRGKLIARAGKYLAKMPEGVSGEHGHDTTIKAIGTVLRGFDLTPTEFMPLAIEYNGRCQPPWSEAELERKIQEADKLSGDRGWLVKDDKGDDSKPKRAKRTPAPKLTTTNEDGVIEEVDDPHRLARIGLRESFAHPDQSTLAFWHGEYHQWNGRCYQPLSEAELNAIITQSAKREFDRANLEELEAFNSGDHGEKDKPPTVRQVHKKLISNVKNALQSIVLVPDNIDQPAWLPAGTAGAFKPSELLFASNVAVHLPSFVRDDVDYEVKLSPRLFASSALDYRFEPNADTPTQWLAFLNQIWEHAPDCIATLRQMFGYLLTSDTSQQKIFLLVGPKRSGKGTIARVLTALLGHANVAGITLSGLATNFGLWPLIGKPLAIVSDARLSGRSDLAVVTERLLSISGEDSIQIDRKMISPVTMRLPTRILICSNELPRLTDASGALAGRLVSMTLVKSFFNQEDVGLTNKLLTELPGILLWAIEGWKELVQYGRFTMPESSKQAMQEMEDLASPVGAFIRERCEVGEEKKIGSDALFQAWKNWCGEHGRDQIGDSARFGRDMRAILPAIDRTQQRDNNGVRFWLYKGISLQAAF